MGANNLTSDITYFLQEGTDDSWIESGSVFLPDLGDAEHASVTVGPEAGWIEFDVSSFISAEASGDETATFMLRSSISERIIHTRENSVNPPELVVNS